MTELVKLAKGRSRARGRRTLGANRSFRNYYAGVLSKLEGESDGRVEFAGFDVNRGRSRILYRLSGQACVVRISDADNRGAARRELSGRGINVQVTVLSKGRVVRKRVLTESETSPDDVCRVIHETATAE